MKKFLLNGFLANLLILVVVGAIVFISEIGRSKEHDWRVTFLNQYGDACCDEIDCREIPTNVALRLRIDELGQVGDLGLTPVNAIHPTQDGRSWFCTTGCLFRPSLQ